MHSTRYVRNKVQNVDTKISKKLTQINYWVKAIDRIEVKNIKEYYSLFVKNSRNKVQIGSIQGTFRKYFDTPGSISESEFSEIVLPKIIDLVRKNVKTHKLHKILMDPNINKLTIDESATILSHSMLGYNVSFGNYILSLHQVMNDEIVRCLQVFVDYFYKYEKSKEIMYIFRHIPRNCIINRESRLSEVETVSLHNNETTIENGLSIIFSEVGNYPENIIKFNSMNFETYYMLAHPDYISALLFFEKDVFMCIGAKPMSKVTNKFCEIFPESEPILNQSGELLFPNVIANIQTDDHDLRDEYYTNFEKNLYNICNVIQIFCHLELGFIFNNDSEYNLIGQNLSKNKFTPIHLFNNHGNPYIKFIQFLSSGSNYRYPKLIYHIDNSISAEILGFMSTLQSYTVNLEDLLSIYNEIVAPTYVNEKGKSVPTKYSSIKLLEEMEYILDE